MYFDLSILCDEGDIGHVILTLHQLAEVVHHVGAVAVPPVAQHPPSDPWHGSRVTAIFSTTFTLQLLTMKGKPVY